jgi:hypothetical protein
MAPLQAMLPRTPQMKRLSTIESKDFRPLKLTGFELEEIFDTLAALGKVELIADDVQYDSVAEFVKELRGRVPKVVRLTSFSPYVTIDLHSKWAQVRVSTTDLQTVGLFAKLSSILINCERRPSLLYSGWWIVMSMWVLQALTFVPPLKPYSYIQLWRYSLVLPLTASDPRTFWQRNSDNAIIALISALIGAAAGAAATRAADLWWPATSQSPSGAGPVKASPGAQTAN